jgi:hypothetical protein
MQFIVIYKIAHGMVLQHPAISKKYGLKCSIYFRRSEFTTCH